jgi:ribosomal protection tetracycline resistance protein
VRTLNLGILAHVDAGKTSLTERLLHTVGVIDELGSVDQGSTQTDSLALERQRGITIKSAVVSFVIDDATINLIDTPGHPDFIAEVERVLSVLDGAVLVLSAVEGVQPQARILMRALQRLNVPTLIFVNKIDRTGAGYEHVLGAISERLSPAIVAMGSVDDLGTRAARFMPIGAGDAPLRLRLAELLAEQDDSILAAYVAGEEIPYRCLRDSLATQAGQALVYPVFFGSAITGAGVDSLMAGMTELLPAAGGDADGPVSGSVFKIERGPAGEKVAYARMFSGTVRVRDRLQFAHRTGGKVTAISVFDRGAALPRTSVVAGQIGKLWGLSEVRIGDPIGAPPRTSSTRHQFAPPTLETIVVPTRPADGRAVQVALAQLAEQDPLIDASRDEVRRNISVFLYGEVQKEVIEATLANDFGLDVTFRETTPICIERPIGAGEAVEILHAESNPYLATVGLRIDPAPDGSGIDFRLRVEPRTLPLYLYKTAENFREAMGQYVRETLQEGIFGWQVTDCVVTMSRCAYSVPDGPPSKRGPLSKAADFRKLTPIVVRQALERARTVVCEPVHRFHLEFPADVLGPILPALTQLRALPQTPVVRGSWCLLAGDIPAAHVHELTQRVPALTRGEGVLESTFDHYQPIPTGGPTPTRPRSQRDPATME